MKLLAVKSAAIRFTPFGSRLGPSITALAIALPLFTCGIARGQNASGFLGSSAGFLPERSEYEATGGYAGAPPSVVSVPTYLGRAALAFDSNGLTNAASGSFVPSQIPVRGDVFYSTSERAVMQGAGGVELQANLSGYAPGQALGRVDIVSAGSAGDSTSANASLGNAYVQWEGLIVGLSDSALADPSAFIPIDVLDLAGPNSEVTVLSPTKNATQTAQGRLSYLFSDSVNAHPGLIPQISIEQPTPEIQNVTGTTPTQTSPASVNSISHYPDLIGVLRWGGGNYFAVDNPAQSAECLGYDAGTDTGPKYVELWHVQLGSIIRDLSAVGSTDATHPDNVRESAMGWGLQLSGFFQTDMSVTPRYSDAFMFSVIGGEGLGHYINDLHIAANSIKSGGNDAFYNTMTHELDALPAVAAFGGYLHRWTYHWESTIGYGRVDLQSVSAEFRSDGSADTNALTMLRKTDYALANLVYYWNPPAQEKASQYGVTRGPSDPQQPANIFAGLEALYGDKEELSGQRGHDNRIEFVVGIVK